MTVLQSSSVSSAVFGFDLCRCRCVWAEPQVNSSYLPQERFGRARASLPDVRGPGVLRQV